MANRWKNNLTTTTVAVPSATKYTGRADGIWGLNSQLQSVKSNTWTVGSIKPPLAPTITSIIPLSNQLTVSFSPLSDFGGGGIKLYIVKDSTNTYSVSGTSSPLVLTGLSNTVGYTLTVTMTDNYDQVSPASATMVGTPTNAYVIFGNSNSTNLVAYSWSEVTGIGSVVGTLSNPQGGYVKRVQINAAQTYVVGCSNYGLFSNFWTNNTFSAATGYRVNDNNTYNVYTGGLEPGWYYWGRNQLDNVNVNYSRAWASIRSSDLYFTIYGPGSGYNQPYSRYIFPHGWGYTVVNRQYGLGLTYSMSSSTNVASLTTPTFAGTYSTVRRMAIEPGSRYVVFCSDDNNTTTVYAIPINSDSTSFGTKWSGGPTGLNSNGIGAIQDVDGTTFWNCNNANNAIALTNCGYGANVYRYYSSSWGTKYTEPSELSTAVINSLVWTKTGNAVICNIIGGTATGSYAYRWTDANGFGTKYLDPSTTIFSLHCAFTQ